MTKRHQQFYQARKEIFSFRQLRISQAFLRGRGNETIEPIQRLYFYVSIVQAESKFINIPAHRSSLADGISQGLTDKTPNHGDNTDYHNRQHSRLNQTDNGIVAPSLL